MLAIALRRPGGIGPEVALKAVAAELPRDTECYLFIGDEELVRDLNERLGVNLPIAKFRSR
jgi:4-hydroxy-L-threonine phosphate dehydrogenase PdxA